MAKMAFPVWEQGNEVMRRFVDWLDGKAFGVHPHYGYSGRWMFGQTCFGLEGNPADIQCAFREFVKVNPDARVAILKIIKGQRIDNMGLSHIVYFPTVDLKDKEDD